MLMALNHQPTETRPTDATILQQAIKTKKPKLMTRLYSPKQQPNQIYFSAIIKGKLKDLNKEI